MTEENLNDIKIGDNVDVSNCKDWKTVSVVGRSKGKGFQGLMKRHGFRGQQKTHGQSDRLRAPGSIGGTTYPGRVYKGKPMAGHMGFEQITTKKMKIVSHFCSPPFFLRPASGCVRPRRATTQCLKL